MKGWDLASVKAAAARGLKIVATDGGGLDLLLPSVPPAEVPAKRNKFGNIPVVIDDIRFQSTWEGTRYLQLKMLRSGGVITGFRTQVSYFIEVNGYPICEYRADFVIDWPDGTTTVEDTKGVETPEFKIKKKLMLAVLGIEIILVKQHNNNGKSNIKKRGKPRHARR